MKYATTAESAKGDLSIELTSSSIVLIAFTIGTVMGEGGVGEMLIEPCVVIGSSVDHPKLLSI